MATTGVVGQQWRADVTAFGSVEPWDGSSTLHWYIAAEDRWHDPNTDSGVRHRRLTGTAVFETKMRIPGGDAVQRVWSVADGGGYTLIEVHNDSALPIACAVTRPDALANRPLADVPIQGIDLPSGSVLLPIGHRSSAVIGLAHRPGPPPMLPSGLPAPDAVVRGWTSRTDAASRLELPEAGLADAVRAARCEVLLGGTDHPDVDPERFLLGVCELVRMSELDERNAQALAIDVAEAVATVAAGTSPLGTAALDSAGVVLAHAGERRALGDLTRLVAKRQPPNAPVAPGGQDDIATIAAIEGRIARGATLFPWGFPAMWLGVDFQAHGLVAGPSSRLSVAVRWHGENAAVLWEIDGDAVTLTTAAVVGGWSSNAQRGEALLPLAPQTIH